MRQDSPGSRRDAPCRCGHDRDTHAHLRRGSDCGSCNCPKWRYCPARLAGTSRYGIAGMLGRLIRGPGRPKAPARDADLLHQQAGPPRLAVVRDQHPDHRSRHPDRVQRRA